MASQLDDEAPKPPFTYTVSVESNDHKQGRILQQADVSDDGELVCMKCRLANCEHIKAVLELNLDVNIFYLDWVVVPLDLQHGMFVKFQLIGPPVAGSKTIRLHPDEGKVAEKVGTLGFLSNGEPRKVLRSILLDWVKYYMMNERLGRVCLAKTHGYHEQREREANMAAQGIMPYLETWSNIKNECCLACLKFLEADDDMIPSAPKRGGSLPPRTARRAPRPGSRV